MRKTLLSFGTVAALLAAPLQAAVEFDFKDPKGVNAISFHLDSLLEPIAGTASGITGTVHFDPANPAATKGKIHVATNSLTVPNSTMEEHLHSDGWLDAAGYPQIKFEITGLDHIESDGNTTKAHASGSFTLKGVTKEVTVPVTLTHLKGAFGKRVNKPEIGGDLLVVRGEFSISRTDFGIRPGQNEDKVADQIDLTIAIVGGAPNA